MKNVKMLSLLMVAALMLTFAACNDDDDDPVKQIEISQLEISQDNTQLTVTFNQDVYGNAEKTMALDANSFEIVIYGGNQVTASYTVDHTAGSPTAVINVTYQNDLAGDEEIEVKALADKVFGEQGNALSTNLTEKLNVNTSEVDMEEISLSDDNTTVEVTFNQPVYKNADKTGALDDESLTVDFSGDNPVDVTYTVDHTAGEETATIHITYQNRVDPGQELEITAVADQVYGAGGNALGANSTATTTVNDVGIVGMWSAYDISVILQNSGFDDSLYANFYADQSYMVTAYQGGQPIVFEGVYTMEKTQFDEIWEIVLNQSAPSSVISEGIFKIFPAAQDSMWYEVAQVDPAIAGVSPPTAAEGFGSTSSGAFGTANIQKYYWIGQE
ncbi:MAG: hypothetical protein ACLFPE_02750 [Bacteroidales bacterium]